MLRPSRKKLAFTLVELLVVIAIIGVLIALLLPAVQAAREAARRTQCTNNLKQLGLALHNYHDVNKKFPHNGVPQSGSGTSMQRGPSWIFRTLPFLEQENAIDLVDYTGDWSMQDGSVTARTSQLFGQLRVDGLWCPSSPLPETKEYKGVELQITNYVGISGSYYTGGTTAALASQPYYDFYGRTTYNGVISIEEYKVGMNNLTDGTSNTLMVSEQSDYQFDNAGSKRDLRSCGYVGGGAWSCGAGAKNWSQNVTTIRYPIAGGYNLDGNQQPYNVNIPLFSSHPTGILGLLGDGSVRFVSETIDFATLTALADRQDGNVVSEF